MTDAHTLIVRFRAPDRPGILASITPLLAAAGCDVREAQIYGDPDSLAFFVRIVVASPIDEAALASSLASWLDAWADRWSIVDADRPLRTLIAVSRFGHCLVDLIHKQEIGSLPIAIVGVLSNHPDMAPLCNYHGIAYTHAPMDEGKAAQEDRFRALIEETNPDLVVLARYMQVLSNPFAQDLAGRCINIHHSFLPSFKGAKPYHQAHGRGVKLIGATAHYVTADLDEGPIIEQDVRRITHATTADQAVGIGREIEASVLSRAVKWHAEHRVFINGQKTVVLL
jgi:formyltetrahydrofolate deformylase